jgi:fatty acid desaturase
MSPLDQDTSTMRMRIEATPIELRKPEMGPQSKARGILVGALLGVGAWAAIIALGVAVWRWFSWWFS